MRPLVGRLTSSNISRSTGLGTMLRGWVRKNQISCVLQATCTASHKIGRSLLAGCKGVIITKLPFANNERSFSWQIVESYNFKKHRVRNNAEGLG